LLGYSAHNNNLLPEILGPDFLSIFDDDIFTSDAVYHMFPKPGAHRFVVGCEANADQIVIIVRLVGVVDVMDIEQMLTLKSCGFDTLRRNEQAIHFHTSRGIVKGP